TRALLAATLLSAAAQAQYNPQDGIVITRNPNAPAPQLAQGVTTEPVTVSEPPFNAQHPQGDVVPVPPNAPPPPPAASLGLGKVFDEADTNHDNIVTKAEFLAKAERHFGMADENKDGQITREEMQAQQQAVLQQ